MEHHNGELAAGLGLESCVTYSPHVNVGASGFIAPDASPKGSLISDSAFALTPQSKNMGSGSLKRLDFYAPDFPEQPLSTLLNCAVLDFFRYHPITGLCSDCPVEFVKV